jgi:hypothetical protein
MTRSPLAYPLNRSADMDAGGAADLQTDIMRFMAILSLCLVAIFALVQSIPLQPAEPAEPAESVDTNNQAAVLATDNAVVVSATRQTLESARPTQPATATPNEPGLTLTRPKWVPKFMPKKKTSEAAPTMAVPTPSSAAPVPSDPVAEVPPPPESEAEGFTLRFESDAALTRLVAANSIGVYAVGPSHAQRMTVSDSRISFWDASVPNSFHEMETATVPTAVIEALSRSGTAENAVSWGVTLPARLKTRLDDLMLEHRGGTLIIVSSGDIRWEAS